jgi:hypothetical protein
MNLITQIKAAKKTASAQMERAKKRLVKAEKNARAAAQEFQAAKEEMKTTTAALAKIDESLKAVGDGDSTRAKPGPKPKAAAKPHHKPGPKPKAKVKAKAKAKVKAKAASKKAPSRAAQGRREVASGKRPPIKDVISKVLGNRVLHANEIYEAIKAKGQLPNSGDPRGYIGYLLSASKTTIKQGGKEVEVPLFERVHDKGRGFYKNRGVSAKAATAKKATPAPKAAAKAPAKKAAAPAKKAAAKAAPVKDGKRTVTCSKCGATGHNAKGHDRTVGGEAKAAPKPAKEPKAAKPAKTEPAKADGKRTVKCGKCGELGHNAKGHDRAMALREAAKSSPKASANGHHGAAEPAKPEKAEPESKKDEESKADNDKTTDEILAEAGIDTGAPGPV